MLSISTQNILAIAPLTNPNSTSSELFLIDMNTMDVKTITLPSSFTAASTMAQSPQPWPVEPEDGEINPHDKSKYDSIASKKAKELPIVQSIVFTPDGKYIGIGLDCFVFLWYNVSDMTLITYVPMPRRSLTSCITSDGRFVLLSDGLGDIYRVLISDLNQGKQIPRMIFSHGNTITHISTQCISDNTNVIISSDVESKIRVSKYPYFFDIQSFCMGLPSAPTGLSYLSTSLSPNTTPLLVASSIHGFDRQHMHDVSSVVLPYHTDAISIGIFDISTGNINNNKIERYRIQNPLLDPTKPDSQTLLTTQIAMPLQSLNDSYLILGTPAQLSCSFSEKGHPLPNKPVLIRVPLTSLFILYINNITSFHNINSYHITEPYIINNNNFSDKYDYNTELIVSIQYNNASQIILLTETHKIIVATVSFNPDTKQITIDITNVIILSVSLSSSSEYTPSLCCSSIEQSLCFTLNAQMKLLVRDDKYRQQSEEYIERKKARAERRQSSQHPNQGKNRTVYLTSKDGDDIKEGSTTPVAAVVAEDTTTTPTTDQ